MPGQIVAEPLHHQGGLVHAHAAAFSDVGDLVARLHADITASDVTGELVTRDKIGQRRQVVVAMIVSHHHAAPAIRSGSVVAAEDSGSSASPMAKPMQIRAGKAGDRFGFAMQRK